MRNFIVGAILGVGLGAAGVLLFRPPAEPSQPDVPATFASPAPAASPRAEPTLTGSHDADEAILRRLASVEAEIRRLADALAAVTKDAAGGLPSSTTSQAPAGRVGTTYSAEVLRKTFSDRLDAMEEQLRAEGPQPQDGSNPALWSYWDDIHRARRALEEAQSLEDLRRLSGGEFKRTFKWP